MNGAQAVGIDKHGFANRRRMIRVYRLEVGVKNGAERFPPEE